MKSTRLRLDHLAFLCLVGGLLWVLSFVYAGHFFGNLPVVRHNFTLLIFGIIGISLLPMVIGAVKAKMSTAKA